MDHASGVPDLSFHLLDEITDGFSPDRIIGIGSFGKVYKGVQRNGTKIAVKVLHDMIALDEKQFINEYNNLTKLKHHNIVRLVGYCQENREVSVHYEGRLVLAEEIKRVLCFEYLHNGSLDEYLFDEHHGQDWNTRYVIIKGICNGLKYLHEDLEAPMYHLDLKPANILLDENMEPKIADFGLSRLFGEERTRITTSSIGTLGYLPPEYIERHIISNKLDIFSLGVILLKITTGHSGYSKCFEMPPQKFIQLVQKNWSNRLQKPTDFEEVKRCIEIALRCLEVDRRSRPTIGEIVHQLSETETVIHNLFTQLPHWLRSDTVALDNSTNVRVSRAQQGNDPGPSMQQDPLSKLTASSRLGPGLEGAASGSGPLSKVKFELLRGDNREIRTEEELKRHIVQGFVLGDDVNENRHVLFLATLSASVTYSAGLSPPGGFWLHNVDGGMLLADQYPRRYKAFFYCNATAFVASLVVVYLLLVRSLCHRLRWLHACQAALIVDLFGLMGAYAAGSCRDKAMSLYVFVQVASFGSYVLGHTLVFALFAAPRAFRGGGMDTPDGSMEWRNYLLLFATLAASITYQDGLGGFWAGSNERSLIFIVFFYSNTTAFFCSLAVVMLLMSNSVTRQGFRSNALWMNTAMAMVGLMGAFASGSWIGRSIMTSTYIVALVAAVLFYIALLCEPMKNLIHDAQTALQRYLRFEKLEQQSNQHQQSRASEQGNSDGYQILRRSRMCLLQLGLFAASVTYQAGLNPRGGFWQNDASDGPQTPHHYLAGDPILGITYHRRYLAFFYGNATAFISSLVILLLLSNIFSTHGIKYCVLQVAMILDLFGLICAYASGSCRKVYEAVYVSLLAVPVFLYIGIHVVVFMLEVFPAYATWRQALREKLEQYAPGWLKEVLEHAEEQEAAADVERTLEKSRKLLLLLAITVAGLTYQAGLRPPGGFWQESKPGGHVAGDPVFKDNYPLRCLAFFYCNTTAFVSSLAVIMLLVNRKLSTRGIRYHALCVCVILYLVGLMGAFAAVSTLIYVLVLIFAVLLCIALQVVLVLSDKVRDLEQSSMSNSLC